ncbi:TPA: hypothetical protein DDW69_04745 [candidate division CPR2 bacterium]|nr:hypothetical protein [candidate division CPR2 bacterium]
MAIYFHPPPFLINTLRNLTQNQLSRLDKIEEIGFKKFINWTSVLKLRLHYYESSFPTGRKERQSFND